MPKKTKNRIVFARSFITFKFGRSFVLSEPFLQLRAKLQLKFYFVQIFALPLASVLNIVFTVVHFLVPKFHSSK